MSFFIVCPKSNQKTQLNDDTAHIEPFNRVKSMLVVRCICGQIHHVKLPFLTTDAGSELQGAELRKKQASRTLQGAPVSAFSKKFQELKAYIKNWPRENLKMLIRLKEGL